MLKLTGVPIPTTMADADPEQDEKTAQAFSLKNASESFAGKSKDIFGSLAALEQKHVAHEKQRVDSGDTHEDQTLWKVDPDEESKGQKEEDRERRSKRGRDFDREGDRDRSCERSREGDHDDRKKLSDSHDYESRPKSQSFQFRRPSGRAPGRGHNRVPDFRKHPEKWTYYSLEDVDKDDMSESSNKQAAFAFLEECRKRREAEEAESAESFDSSSAACSKGVISFSKRTKTDADAANKTMSSSKAMPSATATVDLPLPDSGTAEISDAATSDTLESKMDAEPSAPESAFKKSRKGIRRNIRTRDDDDD